MQSAIREFNTSGPCDPALHYTVMRDALIAEGKQKVPEETCWTNEETRRLINHAVLSKTPARAPRDLVRTRPGPDPSGGVA